MAPHMKKDNLANGIYDSCDDIVWLAIRKDAEEMSKEDTGFLNGMASDLLPGILEGTVLKWNKLEEALAAHLAQKLSWSAAPTEKWQSLLLTAFTCGTSIKEESISSLLRKDLLVIKERDPACPSLAHAFLHFKGFQGLQVYRVANWLWHDGQKSLASVLQSRVSEVFGMDIHPAAQIGWGIMIDHATGVVIGETAVVGNGCTLLHGVTLGGTGKQQGDRHPKLGENVLVGAGASILGNIKVGDCAKIGASAVVLNDIPASATAVGCPAKVIGRAKEENPASVLDHACNMVEMYMKRSRCLCPFRHLDPSNQGFLGPYDFANRLRSACGVQLSASEAMELFFEMDSDHDGQLTEAEFEENIGVLNGKLLQRSKHVL